MRAVAKDIQEIGEPKTRPDVFRYHDFRALLKDWCGFLKATKPGFSLRALSREAELGTGYLSMVLHGQRNLSNKTWLKLVPLLGLTQQEQSFISNLRMVEDSPSPLVKYETFRRLQSSRAYRESNPRESVTYRYLSHWYYVAIRELAFLPDFQLDAKWIQSHLRYPVQLQEVREAIDFLTHNVFLRVDESGKVQIPDRNIECIGTVYRMALAHFHREMLGLARTAIENVDLSQRTVTGHTLAVSEKDYPKVKMILDEALTKLSQLESAKDSTSVYHVALAAFPISKPSTNGDGHENE